MNGSKFDDTDTVVRKILVVEDEPAIRQVLSETFDRKKFELDFAANGKEALPKLAEIDYDLLIVDLRTPVMSGGDLYWYLAERYPETSRKIIFTSGDLLNRETEELLAESGQPFLAKPFTPGEVLEIVNRTLGLTET